MKKVNLNKNWTLVTIDDPSCLPGVSFYNLIKLIIKIVPFKFVIIDDIYGAVTPALVKNENIVLNIQDFLIELLKVKQFDWGDFFLFIEFPTDWKNAKNDSYSEIIAQTNTTIRAIDDQYMYIYTPYDEIVKIIQDNYQIESIKNGSLEDLDYPY